MQLRPNDGKVFLELLPFDGISKGLLPNLLAGLFNEFLSVALAHDSRVRI